MTPSLAPAVDLAERFILLAHGESHGACSRSRSVPDVRRAPAPNTPAGREDQELTRRECADATREGGSQIRWRLRPEEKRPEAEASGRSKWSRGGATTVSGRCLRRGTPSPRSYCSLNPISPICPCWRLSGESVGGRRIRQKGGAVLSPGATPQPCSRPRGVGPQSG